ncbi:glycosyltransferase [Alphaproteobacteria bacterium GH1-50]|uniref:Glycosyltransferase n=1 Tax=Kangsaoukella pontilimi TaxID=2691042 RepID=A0A7C9IR28_9RHOB|nr:glycosyltransferase [Kangsaoukella pontilimi]MXQ06565.1 glycosyltransferase [Kangsaoukella pontilimi]
MPDTTLIPFLLVIAAALLVPARREGARTRTAAMTLGFAALLAVYLWWRLTQTVLVAEGLSPATVFVWVVFLAELWLWYETLHLMTILLGQTDRRAEADAHEARLRALPPEDLPDVDVLIATYNEPLDVLEKTIAGALALDWPAERLHIHVLDDGRRDWLARYCAERGVNHMTRPDNAHAKAGNINAAIPRTRAPFLLVLDADFVPQRPFLMRAIGFFDDPRIGIVQAPHFFFNDTPLQANAEMRDALPDEQRFFFDAIQPGRDGWDCAFCCGSNGILRRSAMEEIGGGLPTDSITEDMLLTLALMRKGYVTRYLGERLAVGLAPESIDAYFVQRERWARGAIQMLYTPHGPLGPGLTLRQRLMFLPSHWLSQSLCQPLAMATPAIFLFTGWSPLLNAGLGDILFYQIPAIAAAMAFLGFLAPRDFAPIASTVESVLQSFRLAPSTLLTLVRPHGHAFRVTPKGSDAAMGGEDRFTISVALFLLLATGTGLFLNADLDLRLVDDIQLLPMVAFWAVFNMVVLLIVIMMAVPRPRLRTEERFPLRALCRAEGPGIRATGETRNVSLTGALIDCHPSPDGPCPERGDWVALTIAGVGTIAARIERVMDHGGTPSLGVSFCLPGGPVRDRLIQTLFASGLDTHGALPARGTGTLFLLLHRALRRVEPPPVFRRLQAEDPPLWLTEKVATAETPSLDGSEGLRWAV